MVAELFLAVLAGKAFVRFLREALGMQKCADLPNRQKEQSGTEKSVGKGAGDEHKRGEHHGVIPVIDAAAAAALVFHDPGLERAEKENADHVADRVEKADEKQDALIDPAEEINEADQSVQKQPNERDEKRRAPSALMRDRGLLRDIIFCKLLLAAHAFKIRGEKAEEHFRKEDRRDDAEDQRPVGDRVQ